MRQVQFLIRLRNAALDVLTGEWILTWRKQRRANGGGVVLGRSLFVSILVFSVALSIREALDTGVKFGYSSTALREQLLDGAPFLAAVFAGVYVSLYTRFSQQWTYLANVYNQIKATEVRAASSSTSGTGAPHGPAKAMGEWKAGFIEDAYELHLANKRIFASVIVEWAEDPMVQGSLSATWNSAKDFRDVIAQARASLRPRKYLLEEARPQP